MAGVLSPGLFLVHLVRLHPNAFDPPVTSTCGMVYWSGFGMIEFRNVSFIYPGASRPALQEASLKIAAGELVLVAGASGSGKSTLLRCINGLVPHFSGGQMQGEIHVAGMDPVKTGPQGMSRQVGFVFQDPEAQFVVDRVEDEVAFALENLAVPRPEMHGRVEQALSRLGLVGLRARRLDTLSGGERQRVAIAAALALQPQVLVLDEPTSQLDPHSAEEVLQALFRLKQELGLTIVLAEHRLERILPFASRLLYLEANRPGVLSGSPAQVMAQIDLNPPLVRLGKALGWDPLPMTVEAGRQLLQSPAGQGHRVAPAGEGLGGPGGLPETSAWVRSSHSGQRLPPYLSVQEVWVSYGSTPALCGASLETWSGEIAVLMGPNGAGKTTLLRSLVGLAPLQKGSVRIAGRDIARRSTADICRQVGYLPQDPNALLFADTVLEELLITLRNHGMLASGSGQGFSRRQPKASPAVPTSPEALLERLGLEGKAEAYPRDLSVGERQRVALGAVTVAHPGALLLDEPTRGLDYATKQALIDLLRAWRGDGMAVLCVTHDVEFAAAAADRVILLEQGVVTAAGSAREILSRSPVFAPQIARLFPGSGCLSVEDVLEAGRPNER
jgi:energy-coupling factor transport system ATP-binding protein